MWSLTHFDGILDKMKGLQEPTAVKYHDLLFYWWILHVHTLVPRALFPGCFGGVPTSKAREKRPGDEVGMCNQAQQEKGTFFSAA